MTSAADRLLTGAGAGADQPCLLPTAIAASTTWLAWISARLPAEHVSMA
jgi:hypothetical protein